MQTVQECLGFVSRKEIIDQYMYHFPPDCLMLENKDITLAEIHRRTETYICSVIDKLLILNPVIPDDQNRMVFCVGYSYIEDQMVDENVFFVSLYELMDSSIADEDVQSYSCLFVPYAEIAGAYVADNNATKDNLAYLLAYILNEITFFGSEEKMEEEKEILHQRAKEAEEGTAQYLSAAEVFAELGYEPREEFPREEEFVGAVREKEIALNRYLFGCSIEAVRKNL